MFDFVIHIQHSVGHVGQTKLVCILLYLYFILYYRHDKNQMSLYSLELLITVNNYKTVCVSIKDLVCVYNIRCMSCARFMI